MANREAAGDLRHSCRESGDNCVVSCFLENFLTSRSVIASIIFAVVCGLAATFDFARVPAEKFPESTWTGWAIQDFLSAKSAPDVVFLGSSLVLVPVAGVDANFLNRRLDGSQHHQSAYFESRLKAKTGRAVRSFNFALPGEMPSDAYLITDFLLNRENKPKVVVYGLGPRDFMDNLLPNPGATDPYRSLIRFGDVSSMIDRMTPDWIDRLNFNISRTFYLYGLKQDLVAEWVQLASKQLSGLMPVPAGAKPYSVEQRRMLLPDYRPAELNRAEAYFRPSKAEHFADNLAEYKKRYAHVKWDTFTSQMRFFAELLDICQQRGIQVVIVSMPITDLNRSLIKDYSWEAYRKSVHVLSTVKGATFVDLQGTKTFNVSDFMDTVHLHSGGGKKMLDLVVEQMAQDKAVRTALELPELDNGSKNRSASSQSIPEKRVADAGRSAL
jgi:hypothetical protein